MFDSSAFPNRRIFVRQTKTRERDFDFDASRLRISFSLLLQVFSSSFHRTFLFFIAINSDAT